MIQMVLCGGRVHLHAADGIFSPSLRLRPCSAAMSLTLYVRRGLWRSQRDQSGAAGSNYVVGIVGLSLSLKKIFRLGAEFLEAVETAKVVFFSPLIENVLCGSEIDLHTADGIDRHSCCSALFRVLHRGNILDIPRTGIDYCIFAGNAGEKNMTYLDVAYRYRAMPTDSTMRAINAMREVYGIQRVEFNEKDKVVSVRFDASRLTKESVLSLLRRAGVDVEERLALA